MRKVARSAATGGAITQFDYLGEKFPLFFLLAVMIYFRHKDNIARLIKGAEPRIGGSS